MTRRMICLFLLVLTVALSQVAVAAQKFDLPGNAEKLLPADAAALVAVTSANELADQVVEIMNAIDATDAGSRPELIGMFTDPLGGLASSLDLDRPVIVAFGLPNLMGGGEPPYTIIVPMLKAVTDVTELDTKDEYVAFATEGRYLALSTDPAYVPSATPPELTGHLASGVATITLDLETVVLNFRPFIEMGLAGIPSGPEADMTTEEAAALAGTIRKVMDSVTRLDLSLGRDDELITWFTGLGFKPGTAMDPGPQPEFKRAIELTKALPKDADFYQVIALDQTRMFATFRDYYMLTMKNSLKGMDDEHSARYGAWVEKYVEMMDLWANPMAASLRLDGTGMTGHMIMEVADADAAVERMTEILEGMTALDIGYTLNRLDDEKIEGAKFRIWDIDFDLEQFEATMPQGDSPAMTGTARMQAEQMVSILRKIMPRVYLGTKDGKFFMASDDDSADLAKMVKSAGKRGKPIAAVKDIAKQTGPNCQQVITGDMLAILNWMTELLEEMDEQQHDVVAGNPIPFQASVTVGTDEFGFDMGMNLSALGRLIAAIEEMEALGDEGAEAEAEHPTEHPTEHPHN